MIQHVKCYRTVKKKCYGWRSVEIGYVELRVKLEPKTQTGGFLEHVRANGCPALDSTVAEGLISEWGTVEDLAESTSRTQSGSVPLAARKKGTSVRGHFLGVMKRKVE